MPKVLTSQNIFVKSGGGNGIRGLGTGDDCKMDPMKSDKNKNLSTFLQSCSQTDNIAEDDDDDFNSTSSIIEFLTNEQECLMETDAESIFKEVSRYADNSDTRSVDEILKEAERLMNQRSLFMGGAQENEIKTKPLTTMNKMQLKQQNIKMNTKFTKSIENSRMTKSALKSNDCLSSRDSSGVHSPVKKMSLHNGNDIERENEFEHSYDNPPSESLLSQESVPKDMQSSTLANFKDEEDDDATTVHINGYDTDDGTDTMEEITENMETMHVDVHDLSTQIANNNHSQEQNNDNNPLKSSTYLRHQEQPPTHKSQMNESLLHHRRSSTFDEHNPLASPIRRPNSSTTQHQYDYQERRNSVNALRSSLTTTPDSGIYHSQSQYSLSTTYSPKHLPPDLNKTNKGKTLVDKSCNSSPKHLVSTLTSPIEMNGSFITREHNLKQEIEQLQEKLKDTEERLESIRIQNESLSQTQRSLRENNARLQEQSEILKLDVQHLTECANVLRSELNAARTDRNDALELQKVLQHELEESRQEKKRVLEQKEKDAKMILDLQRQCREMERILIRKHPDSVSALIVASKNTNSKEQENHNSRKLLEQRIAQLESDAKAQDDKAQQILANVQARFNSVQAKYETHIADLETQVLSLQEINTKLNEKIEYQTRTLDILVKKRQEKYFNNCTQTDEDLQGDSQIKSLEHSDPNKNALANVTINAFTQTKTHHTRDHATNTIGVPVSSLLQQNSPSSSASSTTNSTPNNSRPNSKQSGLRRPASGSLSSLHASKLPVSQSDSTIALSASACAAAAAKEDAHLIATIRGMRVDLAIKSKALQRLTKELEDCKKTMKKLQKERDQYKSEKQQLLSASSNTSAASSRRGSNLDITSDHTPANTESQALREALNKYKLLEADYKALHDKRLQDLKTLQTAHERELASCHETVRILQQRLNEREEQNAGRKARKVPVDYYALKAKVSSLERRHTEREERLHLLVEALSKGRMNGTLEDLARDNNNE